jgi:hypothetical protein
MGTSEELENLEATRAQQFVLPADSTYETA